MLVRVRAMALKGADFRRRANGVCAQRITYFPKLTQPPSILAVAAVNTTARSFETDQGGHNERYDSGLGGRRGSDPMAHRRNELAGHGVRLAVAHAKRCLNNQAASIPKQQGARC